MSTAIGVPGATTEPAPAGLAERVSMTRRLLRRPLAVICLCYLTLIVGIAVVAPLVLPHVAGQRAGDLTAPSQSPSARHWLGTDTLGRDIAERLLVGTRVTLLGVGEALIVVLVLGVTIGILAGYFGGWIDRVVTGLADLAFSIPAIVIIIVVLSVFPANMLAAMVTLGVLAAPGLMRLVRSATLPVREELYIAAAQVAGLSRSYIVFRHVLPRIRGPIIVQGSLLAAVALLVQTGLAFLNLLVQAPAPSWGGMIADGDSVISSHPWLIWPPGLAVALTALALGLFGDTVRDASVEGWASSSVVHRRVAQKPRTSAVSSPRDESALLSVAGLTVSFAGSGRPLRVVEDVSFEIHPGEIVGVVGETGCGKSITASAILGLLPGTAFIETGSIWFRGRDLAADSGAMRTVRGKDIALVSQEPTTGLDPAFRVGAQLAEVVRRHHRLPRAQTRARVLSLLEDVRLPEPDVVARKYPHELSGGMAQRVSIARALAGDPALLIADEPTTALDVTIQAEILDLFRQLRDERQMSILIITHDWGVVAQLCDRALVMYGGQVVEQAPVRDIFQMPLQPYTRALLESNPHGRPEAEVLPTIPGTVPAPGSWPDGCRFRARCGYAVPACEHGRIELAQPAPDRETRCVRFEALRP